jgi:hypothetical protein
MLQYAVLAAAGAHGGTKPGLLDDVALREADDFRQYARHAKTWTSALAILRYNSDYEDPRHVGPRGSLADRSQHGHDTRIA